MPSVDDNPNLPGEVSAYRITYDSAMASLDHILADIDGPTARSGGRRRVVSCDHVLNNSPMTRSAVPDADTLMYLVHFENEEGYAILAADSRLDEVIMVTEYGTLHPRQLVASEMDPSVRTADLDTPGLSLEEELGDFIGDIGMSYAIIALLNPDLNEPESRSNALPALNKYGPLLKTKWYQRSPFNDRLNIVHKKPKDYYAAGCVAIAVSQICVFTGKTITYETSSYGPWEWSNIRSVGSFYYGDNLSPYSGPGNEMTSQFVYDMGRCCSTSWGASNSSSNINKAESCLKKLGYKSVKQYSDFRPYKNEEMIKANKPVFQRAASLGKNHAWVIDGFWYYEPLNGTTMQRLNHCNMGWASMHDGWYAEKVFTLSSGMVSTDHGDWQTGPKSDGYGQKYNKDYKMLMYNIN